MVYPADLFELSFASYLVKNEVDHCLAKQAVRLGVSLMELKALWIAVKFGEITLIELARLTARHKDEYVQVMESLEADGLIARDTGDDTKKCVYSPTEQGRKTIELLADCPHTHCRVKSIDSQVIKGFVELAHRLVAAFRGTDVSEKP